MGVCLSACCDTPREQTPPWEQTPQEQTPQSRHPPSLSPGSRHPPGSRHLPRSGHPLPREADSSIWSTSSQYASYWNAFLFDLFFPTALDYSLTTVLHNLSTTQECQYCQLYYFHCAIKKLKRPIKSANLKGNPL